MNHIHKTLVLLTLVAFGVGCGYSKPSSTTMQTSAPAISGFNPTSVTAGTGQFPLEVDGSNFATGAVVNFNGNAQTTTYTNAGKVTATIPGTAITASGMVPVTVTNPATGGVYGTPAVTSAPMNFTITP